MTPPGGAVQPLTIRLPKDLYERLRKAAFDQRTTMNALVIAAVRKQQDRPRRAKP